MFPRIAGLVLLLGVVTAAFAQSPLLLVLEKSDKTLAIIDPARSQVLGRVPAGEDPHEIVVTDDGRTAYITNYGAFATPQHTLTVIDIAGRKTLGAINLGSLLAPHGISLGDDIHVESLPDPHRSDATPHLRPLGLMVYFTAEGSKAIARYNAVTKQVDMTLGIGQDRTHMIVVRGDRIFTSNVNSDSVSILEHDPKADVSGWTQTNIPVGKGPEGFDVSPDGSQLWSANSHDGTVSIVDVATKRLVGSVDVHTSRSNRLKFTPDGKRVLISDLGNGDLVILEAATRRELKRLKLGKAAAGILIQPDGARAYVAASADNYVAIVDLKTLTVAGHIPTGNAPDGMAWVPAQ